MRISELFFNFFKRTIFVSILLSCLAAGLAESAPKDFYMVILRDPDAQMIAIENGKVDVLGELIRPVDIERLSKAANVELSIAPAFHGFYISFNLRRHPFDDVVLRRAVWQVIPKDRIVRDLFSGYADPVDTFLPPASNWIDTNVTYLEYNPDNARASLAASGWTWGSDGILINPKGDALKPLKLISPTASSAPTSAEIANRAAEAMRSIGIPIEMEPLDFTTMISKMNRHEFDAVAHAWSLTRDPDSLYAFYHSAMNVEGGYNISGISDPELDKVLLELRNAPNEMIARGAASDAQVLLSNLVPSVPIYSRYSVAAVQKGWDGVYSSEKTTSDNFWTLIGAAPSDGKERPLYWSLPDEPRSLNPFTSTSAYDWMVMGHIYDTLISIHPDTLEDMPWLASEWSISDDEEKTVLTFKLRDDIKWHDGEPLTVEDVIASLQYLKKIEAPRYYDSVKDIESTESPEPNVLVVRFSNTSYWHLHNVGGMPILPKHIIEQINNWQTWQPANEPHPTKSGLTQLIGTGPFVFKEYRPGDFVHFTRNENFWNPTK